VNFLADESVDFPIVKSLRENNFTVDYIPEIKPGIPDEKVIKLAHQKNRVLITADKDFGDLTYIGNKISEGIILYRLSGMSNPEKAELVLSVIKNHISELKGSFTVITKDHTRIKTLPNR
jgi:predicted nuclease of predicted toxin-antitoxin system